VMENGKDNIFKVFATMDWWTVLLCLSLMAFGWISICGASYSFEETDIFSLSTRSGMQIVWIGTSIFLGLMIMLTDHKMLDSYAYVIYAVVLLVLLLTTFNPHEIKGSRSWLVIGPLHVQPAEFGKFATALALAKLMSVYGFDISNRRHFALALFVIAAPMICILKQNETGSALVYISFLLVLYREGMPGCILLAGVAFVAVAVLGLKYADVILWDNITPLGTLLVLFLVLVCAAGMIKVYCPVRHVAETAALATLIATAGGLVVSCFLVPFNVSWLLLGICVVLVVALAWIAFATRMGRYAFIALFVSLCVVELYGSDYLIRHGLQKHQRERVYVTLGLESNLRGSGYNVHQSEIAIGSGGLRGKGFLNGTQTKLKFVPEQDTDFIFCTVGEEEGFVGSAGVLLLFLALILRLIHLAERQASAFGRIYGYCVASVFIFHVAINVGMVLGLTPVIGIPLPFFSYGGSSLWGFTIMLFIFLRIDASRDDTRR